MGYCPICGTALKSPREVSRMLGVSASRVRGVLSQHPQRLQGRRVGRHWVISDQAAKSFRPQPHGVRLPAEQDAGGRGVGKAACPKCGETFLSVKQAAQALGRSIFTIYAILDENSERLQAFRVGRRWVIPQRGVNQYKETRAALEKIRDPAGGPQELEIVVKPEKCYCGAYPFPHRKGGGKCQFGSGEKGLSEAQKRLLRRIKEGPVDPDELDQLERRSLEDLMKKGSVEIDEPTGRLKLVEPGRAGE